MKRRNTFFLFYILLFLLFSFFYKAESQETSIIDIAISKKLYEYKIWKALLHYKDGKFYINNKEFLLSYKSPSLKKELIETLRLALDNKKEICKYPARILWLEKELHIKFEKLDCQDFNEYLKKAPADNIYLVFASEDISNPTSMMGHTFFKISGKNHQGRLVEHSISFFAVIDTTNPIKLFYKSFISGMQSFYVLQPYKKTLYRYLEIEERNLWEFPIFANDFNKKLLYYHLWELKFAKSKYYFIGYNCATVTLFSLALIDPELYNEINGRISPRDVVKIAYKHRIIDKGFIVPNDLWLLTLMSSDNSFLENLTLKKCLDNKNWDFVKKLFNSTKEKNIYNLKLAEIYGIYLYKNNFYTKEDLINLLNITSSKSKQYKLQLENISPVNTPPKSKISLGNESFNHQNFLKLSILPFSHTLEDNNKSFLFESSLKIGYLDLLINDKKFLLKEFSIYSMKSLVPLSVFLRKPSKSFFLGIKQNFSKSLKPYTSLNVDYGVGYTLNILNDIYIYALINLGIGYGNNIIYPYGYPEIGFMIYEIFNMKSNLTIKIPYNYIGSNNFLVDATFTHSIYIFENSNISLSVNYLKSTYKHIYNYSLRFRYMF